MKVCTIEQLIAAINRSADVIELSEGTYRIDAPINIDRKKDMSIICENGVIFTSRKMITPIFEKFDDNIYMSQIGSGLKIDNLIVDKEPWSVCRYPQYAPDDILNGSAPYPAKESEKWKNPHGVLRALHDRDWGGNSYVINGKTSDNTLNLQWVGDNNRGDKFNRNHVVIEGVFELLKYRRTWYYDNETGILYIIPDTPENPENRSFEIVTQYNLFNITNSSNISIKGARFLDTARSTFRYPYERPLRGDWGIQRTGCIYLRDTDSVEIDDCRYKRIGGNCVMIDGNCNDIAVKNCVFQDCGASGVLIAGYESACRDFSTWDNHKTVISDAAAGAANDNYPKHICVDNCLFYNLGLSEKQSAAVCMSISSNVSVRNCTVHRMPRAGINISDGCFGGHIIEGNELYDCVRETCDHGPINAWGRDRFWSYKGYNTTGSKGKSKRPYALLDAINPTKIVGNRLFAARGFGIDLDDGASNYEIYNNVTIGVGIKLREGFDRYVHHNLLIGSCFDLHCSYAQNGDVISNNFIVSSKPYNTILLNRGHTTRVFDNYYLHAEGFGKTDSSPILVENVQTDLYDYSFIHPFEGFEDFPLEFGCCDNVPPVIDGIRSEEDEIRTLKASGVKFTDIDESARSASGLDRSTGVYVFNVSPFSPLRKRLKKGDAIVQIGNREIMSTRDISVSELKYSDITLYRNQLKIKI